MRQGWCIGLRLLVQLRANNHVDARISFSSVCLSIIVLNIAEVLILFKGMKKYETIHS